MCTSMFSANTSDTGRTCTRLGSMPILKFFLENQFYLHSETGAVMSWGNYGRGKNKWNIDHIRELHTFDLEDREQFLQACHVTNLQPMWMDENLRKSMKFRKLKKKEEER